VSNYRPMIGLRGFGSHCYSSCPGSGGAAELTGMDGDCSRHLSDRPTVMPANVEAAIASDVIPSLAARHRYSRSRDRDTEK
jgi:hypothetical protein